MGSKTTAAAVRDNAARGIMERSRRIESESATDPTSI
jgi:hypothetical protein